MTAELLLNDAAQIGIVWHALSTSNYVKVDSRAGVDLQARAC